LAYSARLRAQVRQMQIGSARTRNIRDNRGDTKAPGRTNYRKYALCQVSSNFEMMDFHFLSRVLDLQRDGNTSKAKIRDGRKKNPKWLPN
jgi:hypothetical protein